MGAIRNLVDALRREGLTVHEWAGWDGRGNEGIGQIEPHGAVIHHTATAYGGAFNGLVSSTRPGMIGAVLCNFSGNSDGSLTVIASGLAWHAGQGAGPSLGALAPWRTWLNRYSVGLEIVYPGDRPMTGAQYDTAVRFSRVVTNLFGGGNVECIRAHAETNGAPGDGKWDPGYAPGKTIDMGAFRAAVAVVPAPPKKLPPEEDDAMDRLVRADGRKDCYIVTTTADGQWKRQLKEAELIGLQGCGVTLHVRPAAEVDAIGSRSGTGQGVWNYGIPSGDSATPYTDAYNVVDRINRNTRPAKETPA